MITAGYTSKAAYKKVKMAEVDQVLGNLLERLDDDIQKNIKKEEHSELLGGNKNSVTLMEPMQDYQNNKRKRIQLQLQI